MYYFELLYGRQSHGMEAMREELCKAKTELGQIREELKHSSAQKEETISQVTLSTKEYRHPHRPRLPACGWNFVNI